MACRRWKRCAAGRNIALMIMNKTQPCAVDLLIVAVMALAWAVLTIVRLVAVPLVALLIVLLTPRRRPAAVAPPTTPPPTLSSLAADLMALPAKRLMELAGTRRRLPKAQLVALICAMPI